MLFPDWFALIQLIRQPHFSKERLFHMFIDETMGNFFLSPAMIRCRFSNMVILSSLGTWQDCHNYQRFVCHQSMIAGPGMLWNTNILPTPTPTVLSGPYPKQHGANHRGRIALTSLTSLAPFQQVFIFMSHKDKEMLKA